MEKTPTTTTNQVDDFSRSAARGTTVIQFSRANPPPRPAAGDEPPSSPATLLGDAVQAVVLKLANKRIRLKVQARAAGREDDGAGR